MSGWALFTDGSVNTQTGQGFGASLLVHLDEDVQSLDSLRARINIHEFSEATSTAIELQTILKALAEVPLSCSPITIYTDSQNVLSLPGRRSGFEASDYHSKKGHLLRHAARYRAFFQLLDQRGFTLVKVKGHRPAGEKDTIDRFFNLVDKAARKASRNVSRNLS